MTFANRQESETSSIRTLADEAVPAHDVETFALGGRLGEVAETMGMLGHAS